MRRPRLTIRGRLTLVYGGLFLVAGLAVLGVTYVLTAQRVGGEKFWAKCGPGAEAPLQPSGEPRVPPGAAPTPPARQPDTSPGDDCLVGVGGEIAPPLTREEVRKVVDKSADTTLQEVLIQGSIALAVVGAAAIALGWLLAGRLLQPLHRMTETARRIAAAPGADGTMHERIALDGPDDEVKELADTFDLMLERLDGAFDSQRRFIANASHELRTPLTLNRTLLEVALDPDTATPEIRQLGTTLLAVNARHARLIDGLLLLARSERALDEHFYVDLADVVAHVVTQLPQEKIAVRLDAAEAPTAGSPVLLERLVQNLVENALRHNVSEDGWVRVATGVRPGTGQAMLTVENSGPHVPRYEIAGLFEPFRRLGTDRVGTSAHGVGLGLSIVEAVARAHGGTVTAEPRDEGGLVMTVLLPAFSARRSVAKPE
ncbi:sensor protein CutS [Virgisporangium aliadipatigenens]|uniref:histidine kinase n=1 Tax=Virgisporangium aliadipatigenens TaxID=741659 RepID=A0A8J3YUQ9_9ACTN|nr:HAMP domain-containing sensor histidine kinase [Virgisporangium aliadipatigenens]GIJ50883.1 sensor protein CutS [Virgisporangium aliadipatigenens]